MGRNATSNGREHDGVQSSTPFAVSSALRDPLAPACPRPVRPTTCQSGHLTCKSVQMSRCAASFKQHYSRIAQPCSSRRAMRLVPGIAVPASESPFHTCKSRHWAPSGLPQPTSLLQPLFAILPYQQPLYTHLPSLSTFSDGDHSRNPMLHLYHDAFRFVTHDPYLPNQRPSTEPVPWWR